MFNIGPGLKYIIWEEVQNSHSTVKSTLSWCLREVQNFKLLLPFRQIVCWYIFILLILKIFHNPEQRVRLSFLTIPLLSCLYSTSETWEQIAYNMHKVVQATDRLHFSCSIQGTSVGRWIGVNISIQVECYTGSITSCPRHICQFKIASYKQHFWQIQFKSLL